MEMLTMPDNKIHIKLDHLRKMKVEALEAVQAGNKDTAEELLYLLDNARAVLCGEDGDLVIFGTHNGTYHERRLNPQQQEQAKLCPASKITEAKLAKALGV
jgi:hypothetical protein